MKDYHILIFYSEQDGYYIADIPDLQYCSASGATPEEALREVLIGKALWLEVAREQGKPIPEPSYRPPLEAWWDSEPRRILTTKEAAIYLGIAAVRVRQLILTGRLPAEKEGRDWLIKEVDLKTVKERPTGYPKGRPRAKAAG